MGRAIVGAAVVAALGFPTAQTAAAPAHHHLQQPRIMLGVNTLNAPDPTEIRHYEKLAHADPAMVVWYSEFDTPLFTHQQLRDITELHVTPMISWRPVIEGHTPLQFADIAAGDDDAYLESQAIRARQTHRVMFVRFAYEMNLAGQDYGSSVPGETPATFVAAWRHIVTIFRAENATNVRFVWAPNTDCAGRCPFTAYWPGNAYVDSLGLDGYNFAAAHNTAWVSLHYVFATSYATITALSPKPLMFSEVATAPTPGNKAHWIREGFKTTIPTDFPRVRAVVWFDQDKEADWRVNSSPASLKAWRAVAGSKLYSGRFG